MPLRHLGSLSNNFLEKSDVKKNVLLLLTSFVKNKDTPFAPTQISSSLSEQRSWNKYEIMEDASHSPTERGKLVQNYIERGVRGS